MIYANDNPPAPSGGSATEPEDSSYVSQPPLPGVAAGLVALGFGLPAKLRRRRWEIDR